MQGHCEINAAVQRLLPATLSIGWTGAHALFAFSLVRTGLRLDRPLDLLRCYAEFYYGGRRATGEVLRRIFARQKAFNSFSPVLASHFLTQDQTLEGADVIRDLSLKAVAGRAQRMFRHTDNIDSSEILTLAANTIWKSGGNSIEALAEWLDSDLLEEQVSRSVINACIDEIRRNIPPPIAKLNREAKAIAKSVRNERRGYTEQEANLLEQIADQIEEIRQQLDKAGLDGADSVADDANTEDIVSTRRRLAEFMENHPEKWALIETIECDGVPNNKVADREGVSPAAISQRKKEALIALYKFLKD